MQQHPIVRETLRREQGSLLYYNARPMVRPVKASGARQNLSGLSITSETKYTKKNTTTVEKKKNEKKTATKTLNHDKSDL